MLIFIFHSIKNFNDWSRNSIDTQEAEYEEDRTDDFGGASAIGSGGSYNIDDYDLVDSDSDDKLVIDTPVDEI